MAEIIEIATYVSDMVAVEREILLPVERQLQDADFQKYPPALDVLVRLQSIVNGQILTLEHHLESLGGHPPVTIKAAVADALGAATSAIYALRKSKVSKCLRDDHTALALACVAYEMLYTSARVTHGEATAAIALRHFEELTSIAMEISKIIPGAVVMELLEMDPSLDGSVLDDVNENIHNTWRIGAREVRTQESPVQAGLA